MKVLRGFDILYYFTAPIGLRFPYNVKVLSGFDMLYYFTAPIGVRSPYNVKVLSGFEISASWYPPQSSAGLLSQYILQAYNRDKPQEAPVETVFTDTAVYSGITQSICLSCQ